MQKMVPGQLNIGVSLLYRYVMNTLTLLIDYAMKNNRIADQFSRAKANIGPHVGPEVSAE